MFQQHQEWVQPWEPYLINSDSDDNEKVDIAILGITPGSFLEPNVIEGKPLQANEPIGSYR